MNTFRMLVDHNHNDRARTSVSMAFIGDGRRISEDLLPHKGEVEKEEEGSIFNKNTIISAVCNRLVFKTFSFYNAIDV
jgi:hypothetical protein